MKSVRLNWALGLGLIFLGNLHCLNAESTEVELAVLFDGAKSKSKKQPMKIDPETPTLEQGQDPKETPDQPKQDKKLEEQIKRQEEEKRKEEEQKRWRDRAWKNWKKGEVVELGFLVGQFLGDNDYLEGRNPFNTKERTILDWTPTMSVFTFVPGVWLKGYAGTDYTGNLNRGEGTDRLGSGNIYWFGARYTAERFKEKGHVSYPFVGVVEIRLPPAGPPGLARILSGLSLQAGVALAQETRGERIYDQVQADLCKNNSSLPNCNDQRFLFVYEDVQNRQQKMPDQWVKTVGAGVEFPLLKDKDGNARLAFEGNWLKFLGPQKSKDALLGGLSVSW
ncbi:MAG: hypothetical protein HY401_05840 [Elusimicrobia bacterium]|nr:hypothetical protein [Elusimicrobiota bacterium]